jgi:DNA-binding CsgD family transcriptional regulator
VLDCLLRGDSESEAARALALSTHTIHVHVKRLHRYFGTSSRGELLARSHRLLPALRQAPVTIKQMSPLVRVAGL